ncbi:phospho-N-acetylmuramoyl-pentapeptide-transferase [Erysipelothrix sp. HDW6A]|uniref:phospho-N-acetylmuramoyl-pentapeptide- transferase n=1 Tax=Erysipelothrix sp. HDW6A TaxID=2714928 RepID=UPI00140DD4D0|nr:phospho-N-acetylmuramoyl-pentapeptide-transferase [Erysipelothrix sp. HDW6A]QIK57336.1 phospho-N-acetylmuramoyl-pentapeptide-transferase [Erysipelothrix sp. HDW6A]
MVIEILGLVGAFTLTFITYPKFIRYLESRDTQQQVSEYALEAFKNKKKTPTFGGLLFVVVPSLVMILLNGFKIDRSLFLLVFVFCIYALIGFIDDYKIVTEGKNDGLTPKTKMGFQLLFSLVFYGIYISTGGTNTLKIPFITQAIDLGYLYIPFIMFLFSGASNAVNLTDGMDGLAGGTMVIALIPFAYLAYDQNESGVLLFILALIGGLLAFLMFNKKPAQIFMGDVGSLALGAALAGISVLLDAEMLLVVIGGVFVFETLCVIIQKISWKTRHKRVFKYTPIHYSFTLSGWKEADVVNLFYAIGLICMVLGFVLIALS